MFHAMNDNTVVLISFGVLNITFVRIFLFVKLVSTALSLNVLNYMHIHVTII